MASGGLAKLRILRAVLERGYAHVFMTDMRTAQGLLSGEAQ